MKFSKLFINDEPQEVQDTVTTNELEMVNIEVVGNTETTTTIEDIYSQNNVLDKSKSIFKIDEIKSVLPTSLPNEAKKSSVIGMMGISGLNLEIVLEDADKRIEILNSYGNKFSEATNTIVSNGEADILELEKAINKAKEKITLRKKEQEDQELVINLEREKIKAIVNFIK